MSPDWRRSAARCLGACPSAAPRASSSLEVSPAGLQRRRRARRLRRRGRRLAQRGPSRARARSQCWCACSRPAPPLAQQGHPIAHRMGRLRRAPLARAAPRRTAHQRSRRAGRFMSRQRCRYVRDHRAQCWKHGIFLRTHSLELNERFQLLHGLSSAESDPSKSRTRSDCVVRAVSRSPCTLSGSSCARPRGQPTSGRWKGHPCAKFSFPQKVRLFPTHKQQTTQQRGAHCGKT